MQMHDLALTTGPERPYGRRMTSSLIIEQLIADRRADLARSWPRHPIRAEVVADRSVPGIAREPAVGRVLTRLAGPSGVRREAFDDAA
jgi:hypothetical protein